MVSSVRAEAAGRAASESASDGSPSATFRALAWSQMTPLKDPVPYSGEDYTFDAGTSGAWDGGGWDGESSSPTGARPQLQFDRTDSARQSSITGAVVSAATRCSASPPWSPPSPSEASRSA